MLNHIEFLPLYKLVKPSWFTRMRLNMVSVLSVLSLLSTFSWADSFSTISAAESHALIERHTGDANFVILDVRTPTEYAAGHLENSKLLNFRNSDFENKLQQLDKSKTYLVYCRSGGRSGMAQSLMEKLEFKNVYNMGGGFNDWSRAAFPFKQ